MHKQVYQQSLTRGPFSLLLCCSHPSNYLFCHCCVQLVVSRTGPASLDVWIQVNEQADRSNSSNITKVQTQFVFNPAFPQFVFKV